MKNLIDTQDFSRSEMQELLQLIGLLKEADYDGAVPQLLPRRSLGMIFEEPSTRTRVSFEVAMTKLGGHGIYLKPGEIHLGGKESLYDTAKVLSRMCDVIEARVLKHATVVELARDAEVPVINGLSDFNHPTQAIGDIFTMTEHLPAGGRLEDCTVVFVGDRTDVCSSLMFITTQFGMNFIHAAPPAYQAPASWVKVAEANVAAAGSGSVSVTENVEEAVARGGLRLHRRVVVVRPGERGLRANRRVHAPLPGQPGALLARTRARAVHALPASHARRRGHRRGDGQRALDRLRPG